MVTSMVHDGTTRFKAPSAFLLRLVTRGLEGVGILWAVYCAGNAVLIMAFNQRFSDALADAFPLLLAGGLGFTLAWWIAWLARRLRAHWHRRRVRQGKRIPGRGVSGQPVTAVAQNAPRT